MSKEFDLEKFFAEHSIRSDTEIGANVTLHEATSWLISLTKVIGSIRGEKALTVAEQLDPIVSKVEQLIQVASPMAYTKVAVPARQYREECLTAAATLSVDVVLMKSPHDTTGNSTGIKARWRRVPNLDRGSTIGNGGKTYAWTKSDVANVVYFPPGHDPNTPTHLQAAG